MAPDQLAGLLSLKLGLPHSTLLTFSCIVVTLAWRRRNLGIFQGKFFARLRVLMS